MKKNTAIFSKLPSIETIAINPPTAYVNESPGNTLAGQKLKIKKANKEAHMQREITASQEFPVKYETMVNPNKINIPFPASSPLKPAKKLYVVVAPTIPKDIKTRG